MLTNTMTDVKQSSLSLFKDYKRQPTPELRNKILELNLGLVRKEAHHWCNQCSENYDDLLQVGCMGLIRSIERFDPEKGHAFSSFAMPYIRGEIQHYLRDKSTTIRIPRRWLELQGQANQYIKNYRQEYHRNPSEQNIADYLKVSVDEWQEIKLAQQNKELISLDVSVSNEDDHNSLGDIVPDPKHKSFQLAQEDQMRLQSALSQLEDKTRKMVEFVFLHDLTQKEVADILGVSVVTVSRRVKKGLDILKEILTTEL